jgi:hypothetical protein
MLALLIRVKKHGLQRFCFGSAFFLATGMPPIEKT